MEKVSELKGIEKQFTILSTYIGEAFGGMRGSVSGDMAVSALNIIRDYIIQLRGQNICNDVGVNPILTNEKDPISQSQHLISDTCDEIKEILLDKNRKYGDSTLSPKRIFSKASPIEQINVRIDDKLSRIKSAQGDDSEDAETDLLGYLILKKVAIKFHQDEEGG